MALTHTYCPKTSAAVRSCKWSQVDVQENMNPVYHCVHENALRDLRESNGELFACYCLASFTDQCPHFELAEE